MSDPAANVKIEASWKEILRQEFGKSYFLQLKAFLVQEKQTGQEVFPSGKDIFNAFDSTPFDKVKVVILGQDPYHGPGQAHGLCFSVLPDVKTPPSLVNMYKELADDPQVDFQIPDHGHLQKWAEQGVLLLNATLTVRAHQAGSHQKRGWEQFTDAAIHALNEQKEGIVFMLWGSYAQRKGDFIDATKHVVLRSPHPSPLSAYRGFFGNRHFSQCNEFLQEKGQTVIEWQV